MITCRWNERKQRYELRFHGKLQCTFSREDVGELIDVLTVLPEGQEWWNQIGGS